MNLEKILRFQEKTTITLTAITKEGRLRKNTEFGENPYWNNLIKESRVTGIINFSYKEEVNKQRLREGLDASFEPLERKWGQRIPKTPFVEHRGKKYLEVMVLNSISVYRTLDNKEIPKEEIEPFLAPISEGRQGIINKIILRDFAFESITELKIEDKIFRIK